MRSPLATAGHLPSHGVLSHLPYFNSEKALEKKEKAELLPIPSPQKQLESSGCGCQVPLSNLVDILIEEENSQEPPAEMPHVRERLFSFPFAINEFYSW